MGPQNKEDVEINSLLSEGMKVIPAIRARSKWAVTKPDDPRCASSPRDLDVLKPINIGQSYSPSYYSFVSEVAKKYEGKEVNFLTF